MDDGCLSGAAGSRGTPELVRRGLRPPPTSRLSDSSRTRGEAADGRSRHSNSIRETDGHQPPVLVASWAPAAANASNLSLLTKQRFQRGSRRPRPPACTASDQLLSSFIRRTARDGLAGAGSQRGASWAEVLSFLVSFRRRLGSPPPTARLTRHHRRLDLTPAIAITLCVCENA